MIKYLLGKIKRSSLVLTEVWPISNHLWNKNTIASLCITVQCALPKIVSDKLPKLDSKLSHIWNYFRTISEGPCQTESLHNRGSDEPVQMHRSARAFTAALIKKTMDVYED